MKQKRLAVLLLALALVGAFRLLDPIGEPPAPDVAEAIVRNATPVDASDSSFYASAAPMAAHEARQNFSHPPDQTAMLGNAFEARLPSAPVAPPPAPIPPAPKVVAVIIPQQPSLPVDPPPTFQVIGSWDDGKAPGAFVVTPYGTLLARKGEVLQSQYRVVEVNRQNLILQNVTTKRDYTLVVPR